jgi:HTH-type transcriptional regulator/antitoxin HigA
MAATPKTKRPAAGSRWLELAAEFPLRPIRSEAEYGRAVALSDRLIDSDSLTPEEEDYHNSLGDLIADYEDEHEPMDDVPASIVLRELIEARGVNRRAVAEGAGVSCATIAAILAGHRLPSRKHMTALATYFGVDPAAFL